MIRAESLSKNFALGTETIHAVRDVTFTVQAGEFVAIQGPSGCGKSTLLHIIGGLLAPDSGTVTVGGQNLYALSPGQRAAVRATQIGFVFQRFHLVPYLNVLDNVLASTLAANIPDAPARAADLLKQFDMTHRLKHHPNQLSTGERQRVALARALLPAPKVLLADEPTGNLDAENARLVLDVLDRTARSGVSVLLITHDPEAAALTTRQFAMRHGRITTGAVPASDPAA